MKNVTIGLLSGALCLFCPASQAGYQTCGNQVVSESARSCPDGAMPNYHSGQIPAQPQPVRTQTIQSYQSPTIQPVQAPAIQSHQAQTIQPVQAQTIQPYQAQTIQPVKVQTVQPYQAQTIQPYRSQSQPHVFTKQEREEMLRNDNNAGRTHKSMSKESGKGAHMAKRPNGNRIYTDPYNTGGWNYKTNQSASPIWNPNSQ